MIYRHKTLAVYWGHIVAGINWDAMTVEPTVNGWEETANIPQAG